MACGLLVLGEFLIPTMGGHMGSPLRGDRNVVRGQILQSCQKGAFLPGFRMKMPEFVG